MTKLLNYTTTVEVIKTVSEIQAELISHGAKQILMNYADEGGIIESLSFVINTKYGKMPFKLPCNPEPVLKVLEDQELPKRYLNIEHASKVAWRIILTWVKAQMALIETEMVDMEQVFLPYMIVGKNVTLYENMLNSKFQITGGLND